VSVSTIIAALPRLTKSDLEAIHSRIGFLTNGKVKDELQQEVLETYSAIEKVSRSIGTGGIPPLRTFSKSKYFTKFCSDAGIVSDFIEEEFAPKMKLDKLKALQLVVSAVARRLTRDEIPVTYMTLVKNIGRAPQIIDEQFPGYRGCGLLKVLLSRNKRFE
jgi:hypothetical protein